VTTPLGILLIAERAALLSGRDDEFVAIAEMAYTGMRWAEIVGLETEYVRGRQVRVEWQPYELDTNGPQRAGRRRQAPPAGVAVWLPCREGSPNRGLGAVDHAR
jgi:hypothetical protein